MYVALLSCYSYCTCIYLYQRTKVCIQYRIKWYPVSNHIIIGVIRTSFVTPSIVWYSLLTAPSFYSDACLYAQADYRHMYIYVHTYVATTY